MIRQHAVLMAAMVTVSLLATTKVTQALQLNFANTQLRIATATPRIVPRFHNGFVTRIPQGNAQPRRRIIDGYAAEFYAGSR